MGGVTFSRGALYTILKNPLYRGLIQHKGECFPGEHEAIVEEKLFSDELHTDSLSLSGRFRGKRFSTYQDARPCAP